MKVSIIIPVYNVEEYLEQCLDSAVSQTLDEIEIICINDGSTDGSLGILNRYKKKYNNMKIINQDNSGLSAARNAGIREARGEYIYFLDSDDYIDLDTMKVCYEYSKKNNLDVLTFDAECFFDKDYVGNKYKEVYDRSHVIPTNIMAGKEFYSISNRYKSYYAPVWLNFYSYDFIKSSGLMFKEGVIHEDEIHTPQALFKAKKVKYISNKFFKRRIRKNSIMTSGLNRRHIEGNFEIIKSLYDLYLESQNENDYEFSETLKKNINMHIISTLHRCDSLNCKEARAEVVKFIDKISHIVDINSEILVENPELHYSKVKKINRNNELELYKEKKKIFFMLIPTHGNLGDQAIIYSSLEILKQKYPDYKIIKINYEDTYLYIDVINDIISEDDFVVLPGGGNMGNHYIWEEQARRHIISNLINIPIISFPQTIYFSDDEEGRKEFDITRRIYNNHSNLILLAREKTSFEIMNNNFPNCRVELCPDIVLYLNNKLEIEKELLDRKYITAFFRKDKESYYSINDKNKLIQDISDRYDILVSDTVVSYKVNGITRQEELFKLWREFYKSKVVITDRLHGMIFAAITKTPCIVLRSFDYKVIKSYEWISSLNYIKMTDNINLDNIQNMITELESIDKKDDFCFDDKYLDSYYSLNKKVKNKTESKCLTAQSKKYMHISFDDIIDIFKDLTANANIYTSIFSNPTLAYFKYLHDTYGAVISCYCFNYYNGHFLKNTTTKFKTEFQANKNWLKFGHHYSNGSGDYSNETPKQAIANYAEFVNAIMSITEDYECIDRVPRLHNFAGSLENILALKDCPFGLLGALGADDNRQNYYLTCEQGTYALTHEKIVDYQNSFTIFTTDLRMELIDNIDSKLAELKTARWANKTSELIIFTHEWCISENKTKLEKCCQYAVNNGYEFDFPMNNI